MDDVPTLSEMSLVRGLGKGRMGYVKLYRTLSPPSPSSPPLSSFTAVKFISRSQASSNGNAKRVFSERNALLELSKHPYVVDLRGTGKDEEHLYFYMKPLLGGALHKHFRAEIPGRFAKNKAKHYTAQLASALSYLHSLSYLHRDVKASNVLLDEEGKAVLADFGYARKVMVGSGGDGKGGRATTFVGTLHAMAPEVLRCEGGGEGGEGGYGFGADWWALGVLVYEMMTGEPPFGYGVGGERGSCKERIMGGGDGAVFEDGIFKGVGASGEDLIRKLLMVEEEDRLTKFEVMKGHEFFEVIRWEEGEGGWVEVGNEPPEFNTDIGDLEVLEDAVGVGGGEGGGDNNVFAGF
ncbi:hypothetical protein TrCOL_g10539 [Triparma columacea]|uniref:Protein kinase domain-containing protein n=1 Tax=Triparma columacea TaxID=722753 RepID=A0A9W7GNM0_9STRA|nr:hypothetical protein TrCOL_g10539 [Triparma columacea]